MSDLQDALLDGLDANAKLRLANSARLMMGNQRTINTSDATDRANRNLQHRFNESEFEKMNSVATPPTAPGPDSKDIDYEKDDDMQVSIDSPTTNNYYHPNEDSSPKKGGDEVSDALSAINNRLDGVVNRTETANPEWSVGKIAAAFGIPSGALALGLASLGFMLSGGEENKPAEPRMTQEQISNMIGYALGNLVVEGIDGEGNVIKTYPVLPPKENR